MPSYLDHRERERERYVLSFLFVFFQRSRSTSERDPSTRRHMDVLIFTECCSFFWVCVHLDVPAYGWRRAHVWCPSAGTERGRPRAP